MQVPNTSAPARRVAIPSASSFMLSDMPSDDAEGDFDWAIQALRAGTDASFALILAHGPIQGTRRLLALGGLAVARAAVLLDGIADRLPEATMRPLTVEESWIDPGDQDFA